MSHNLMDVHAELGAVEIAEQMASSPVPEPFSLPDGDEDIVADLAAIGITFADGAARVEDIEQSRNREAVAALYLDHASRCEARAHQLAETRDKLLAPLRARIERIERFYAAQISYEARRRDEMVRFVEYLAQLCQYPGKKKSIATPFGTFGFRDTSPGFALADETVALEWASKSAPKFVQVTAKLDLPTAREYLTDGELADCKQTLKWGELKKDLDPDGFTPPGLEKVEGGRHFYAKIEVR